MPSLFEMLGDDPYQANAARIRRRYPTREPDPVSLAASQGKGASWENFLPSEERALRAAGDLQRGEDYNPRDVFLGAIGAVGAPAMGPAQGGAVLGSGAIKPIRAYHGSPHDFERFDLSKIGTGEGAQAYGHGLYFAENPAVAEEYKKALAGRNTAIMRTPLVKEAAADLGSSSKYLPDAILRELEAGTPLDQMASKMSMDTLNRGRTPEEIQRAIDYVTTKFPEHKAIPGRMYEVNINAAPEQMLSLEGNLQQPAGAAAFEALRGRALPDTHAGMSASTLISSSKTPQRGGLSSPEISERLREAGIPGIKYLDQGSRLPDPAIQRELSKAKSGLVGAEMNGDPAWIAKTQAEVKKWEDMLKADRTSNYVLFRDDIIEIRRKFGLPAAISAAAAYGMSKDEAMAAIGEKPKTTIGRQTYDGEE